MVVGYTPPKGGRQGLGSLMLGQYRDRTLVYAGRVGSGMGNALLLDLHKRLRTIETRGPVVEIPRHVPLPKGRIQWVRPELVGQVAYGEWTPDDRLRHPRWRGLRPELAPADVVRE